MKYYGIYNTRAKEFQFGIVEPTKEAAEQRLFDKIGKDAYKWRFEIRVISEEEIKRIEEANIEYTRQLRYARELYRENKRKKRKEKMLKNPNAVKKTYEVQPLPESFVVLDLETTDLSADTGRIIEIGAVRFTKGEPVAIFNCMVKQDLDIYPLSQKAMETTGHTPEDIEKGMDEETAIDTLVAFMYDRYNCESYIVGQNVIFDYEFIAKAVERYGYALDYNLLDTLTIGRDRRPYPHRLPNLCKAYGVEQGEWHSAYFDALATGELLLAMHKEDYQYPPGQQVADYINVIGYKRQYGVPAWYPGYVTLKPQGNITVKEGK